MTLPEKYEDWRLPSWLTDGSDIDPERVGKAIFNGRKVEEELKVKIAEKDAEIATVKSELDDEKARKSGTDEEAQQELKELRKKVQKFEEEAGKPDPTHQAALDRLNDVIDLVDKGLPKALALRVQGDTSEARLDDAKALAEVAGVDFGDDDSGDPDPAENNGGTPPVRSPQSRLRSGFEDKNQSVPSNTSAAAKTLAESAPLFS